MMRNPINVNFDCDEESKKFNEEDDSIDIDDSENVNGEEAHLKSIRKWGQSHRSISSNTRILGENFASHNLKSFVCLNNYQR